MIRKHRRFIYLALLMAMLVAAIAVFSTYYLYRIAVQEQETRLLELVESQASLVTELGWLALEYELAGGPEASREVILDHLSRAYMEFQKVSRTGELLVARQVGARINYLILNGKRLVPDDPDSLVPLDSPEATPMRRALGGESGTVITRNRLGHEVLAAYKPLPLQDVMLALVVEVDLKTITTPFFNANIIILGVWLVLTVLGGIAFIWISEPLIREIQVNEKQYRELVEGAGNFILRVNRQGIITFANAFANRKLGREGGSLAGERFTRFITPDAGDAGLEDVLTSCNGLGHSKDIPVDYSDGRSGWISWNVQAVELGKGQEHELLCIGNDVTVLHLANAAQREVEERFRAIARVSPVGIVITSQDGSLFYANERMHKLTGTQAIDLAGKRWMERLHPEDRKRVILSWFGEQRRFRPNMEFRMVTTDGAVLWVLGQIVELVNDQDAVVGDVISFTDITKIKDTELIMRRLSTVVEQMTEIVLITDLDGTITYVNKAFETITRYSRDEAVGRNPKFLKSGEQDREFYRNLWGALKAGEVWRGRFINKRKDGKRYTQEATIGPVRNESGTVVNYFAIARDITEELVVEAQLRQSQKLESIGQLAAGIAHEINTPTQYVTTNLQFLEDSFAKYAETIQHCQALIDHMGQHCDQADEALARLVEQAIDRKEMEFLAEDIPNAISESSTGLRRIAEIVQSVKQLAHPGEVSKSYYNLNEIVRDAATVSTNEWKYVATVSYHLMEGLPQIRCLKGEVGQVVLNLIVNSAHAIEAKQDRQGKHGEIGLRTYRDGDTVILEVSDTGTGIPNESLDRIFDPFYTTKAVGKGTGQGLAIAHNVIVNMHGGRIDVKTEMGVGSTFIIRLPIDGTA